MSLVKALLNKLRTPLRIFVAVCIAWVFFTESVPYLIKSAQRAAENTAASESESAVLAQGSTEAPEQLLVNINTADSAELTALSGIGTAKARAIVAYREEHGAFGSVDGLLNVNGIGKATLEKLREFITG